MKNVSKGLLFAVVVASAFTSCKSVISISKDAKTISTNGRMYQNGTMTDLIVGEKATHEIVYSYKDKPLYWGSLESQKSQTIAELLEKEKGDVLVEPRFSVTTLLHKPGKMDVTVKVSGYIGRYKNFKPLQPSDSTLLQVNKYAGSNQLEYPSKKGNSVNKSVIVY